MTFTPIAPSRSVLFAPADNPKLLGKLPTAGADVIVLDLEDAVLPDRKRVARGLINDVVDEAYLQAAKRVWVRVNALGSPWVQDDCASLPDGVEAVIVPKIESASDVAAARQHLPDGVGVLAGIETAAGVIGAPEICAAADAAYFGAEDLVASTGGRRREDNLEVLAPRTMVALAAAAAAIPIWDQVVVDFRDSERTRAEAEFARDLGYCGKLCIHPAQLEPVHAAFTPTAAERRWAKRVVDAAQQAAQRGSGVVVVDGRMVDPPIEIQARRLLDGG